MEKMLCYLYQYWSRRCRI